MWTFFSCYIKRRNQPPDQNPVEEPQRDSLCEGHRGGNNTSELSPVEIPPTNLQYYIDNGEFARQYALCNECQLNIQPHDLVIRVDDTAFSHPHCIK